MPATGYADLHLHSTCSDGSQEPSELVRLAADLGFDAIALTDHDTVAGVEDAQAEGNKRGVEVIGGIEISSDMDGVSVHILGYFVDPTDAGLRSLTVEGKERRVARMERMVAKLNKLGYPLDLDELRDTLGDATPGRAHLARFMVAKGHFRHVEAVFTRVLGDGKAAYEPAQKLTAEDAIAIVATAGGVSSLAHPGLTGIDGKIERLVAAGLDGIEVYAGRHSDAQIMRYLSVARKMDLLVTGGSDSHGPGSGARGMGAVRLPMKRVEALRHRAAQRGRRVAAG
ncbi:MAG: PHP domain-containing protein [Nitrospinae bacterium]|nr:PHP domain-containing protein [Nitrospinota bacterium]